MFTEEGLVVVMRISCHFTTSLVKLGPTGIKSAHLRKACSQSLSSMAHNDVVSLEVLLLLLRPFAVISLRIPWDLWVTRRGGSSRAQGALRDVGNFNFCRPRREAS